MRYFQATLALACLAGCKGTSPASASTVEVSQITAPVVVTGPSSGPVETRVSSVSSPLSVSAVASPVAVSAVASPVAVSSVADPVAISGVADPIVVSGVTAPVKVAEIQSPVTVQLARPEFDPERIESGTQASGSQAMCSSTCRKLLQGPFIVTDVIISTTETNLHTGASLFATSGDAPRSYYARWSIELSATPAQSSTTFGYTGSSYVSLKSSGTMATLRAITGVRFAVRTGEALYLEAPSSMHVAWSGFRP